MIKELLDTRIRYVYIVLIQHKLFSTLIIRRSVFLHIIIISEGSCDIEDWSHEAENSALHSQE